MDKLGRTLLYILMATLWSGTMLTVGISAVAANSGEKNYPDVFAREKTVITAGQAVGKLLVEGADIVVEGKVTDGIILVDGNLAVEPGAKISGTILVIGGNASFSPQANLEEKAWVIPSRGFPLASVVVGSLVIAGIASLVILPFALWFLSHLLKRIPLYSRVEAFFLKIQHRWPALYIAGTLLISAVMLTVFVELAWETMFQKTMAVFDNAMIWVVRYFASPGVDRIMIFITDLGYGWPYFLVVSGVFLLISYLRRWREIAGLGICLAGGAVLNYLLKNLFERARPDLFRMVEAGGYSFPSGHAMVSLCFYGMVAFLLVRNIRSLHGRLAVISGVSLLVAAIGVSRIYLGAHYPTDVVAGYAAGSMWLGFCISLLIWWEQEHERG